MFEFCLTAGFCFLIMGALLNVVGFVFSVLALPVFLMPEGGAKAIGALVLFLMGLGTFIWLAFEVWPLVAYIVHAVLTQVNGG